MRPEKEDLIVSMFKALAYTVNSCFTVTGTVGTFFLSFTTAHQVVPKETA